MLDDVSLSLATISAWLVVGLLAGWIVSWVMKLGGSGQFGFIFVGMIGAGIGGLAYRLIERKEAGFWGSVVAAILGAHLLIAMFRFIGFKRRDT